MSRESRPAKNQDVITILLVDDSPETRENVKKMLAFEQDFSVVGAAGTGRDGIEMAKQFEPNIIIMDINMPDMDGLQATQIIDKQVPTSAVIIMSVQGDPDYMRRALRAGARDFLTKPVNIDELYNTIRTVYKEYEDIRRQYEALADGALESIHYSNEDTEVDGDRAGHIITVYSPQGGAGTTTIATSLASGLMKEGIKVLLVDADLLFADIATFLNLQPKSTVVEIMEDVDDIDPELFENIVTTHDSGLKVLLGPARPEIGLDVLQNAEGNTVSRIIQQVRRLYDFVVIDTSTRLDEVTASMLDIADQILLVGAPTLVNIRNMRFTLDFMQNENFDINKIYIVLNRFMEERKRQNATVQLEKINGFLKRPIIAQIPLVDENRMLSAVNKGVPVITFERSQDRAPSKQLLELSEYIFNSFMGEQEEVHEEETEKSKKRGGIASLLGR